MGPQPARYTPDRRVIVHDVVQGEAADNQVQAVHCQGEGLGAGATVPYGGQRGGGGQREHTPGEIDAENMAGAAAGEPARDRVVAATDNQNITARYNGQHPGQGRLF